MSQLNSSSQRDGVLRMSDLDTLDDLRYQEEMDRETSSRRRPFNYSAHIEDILQAL
jgi:hypothetical protein